MTVKNSKTKGPKIVSSTMRGYGQRTGYLRSISSLGSITGGTMAMGFLVLVNVLLIVWYVFAVNFYAGLSFESSLLNSKISEARAKQQELLAETAARSSVARTQQNLNLTDKFVASGTPKVITFQDNKQLSLR